MGENDEVIMIDYEKISGKFVIRDTDLIPVYLGEYKDHADYEGVSFSTVDTGFGIESRNPTLLDAKQLACVKFIPKDNEECKSEEPVSPCSRGESCDPSSQARRRRLQRLGA